MSSRYVFDDRGNNSAVLTDADRAYLLTVFAVDKDMDFAITAAAVDFHIQLHSFAAEIFAEVEIFVADDRFARYICYDALKNVLFSDECAAL